MVSYEIIGKHIKEARLRKGLVQADVAFAIKRSTGYYGKIERGFIRPNLDRLAEICQVLDVPLDSIFRNAMLTDGALLDNTPVKIEEFDEVMAAVGKKSSDRLKQIIMRVSTELAALDDMADGSED